MAVTALAHVDLGVVEEVVGVRAFERGWQYARKKRVLRLEWDDDEEKLVGLVLGNGATYETEAYFLVDRDGGYELQEGDCTCPVEHNCKHVAAIVVAAAGAGAGIGPFDHVSAHQWEASLSTPRRQPAWEEPFLALLDPPGGPGRRPDGKPPPEQTPLAIELRLDLRGSSRNFVNRWLSARIVRPGRRDGVHGGLSWGSFASWPVMSQGYPADQVVVLRALHALHLNARSSAGRGSARGDRGDDKELDVACFDPMLWAVLEEAHRVGLRLLHADPTLGEVDAGRRADLYLDLTRSGSTGGSGGSSRSGGPGGPGHDGGSGGSHHDGGSRGSGGSGDDGLVVTPTLRVDGVDADVVPVGFVGATGHGVVYTERANVEARSDPSTWRLGLARLTTPAPLPLQQFVRPGRRIEVPAVDRDRFAAEIWPRLRHVAAVVSSDGSFVEPTISGPRLVLRACYGIGHVVDITGEWTYDVGGSEHRARFDADPAATGYRDPVAEQDLVASLDSELTRLGLRTAEGLRPHVQLTGLDTLRFTTEVLPLLSDQPAVMVEVTGPRPRFREVTDDLVIGLSTEAVPDETDWFDLGIDLTVDGHELAFADVFRALAAGESHLLLADGAYLCLEKPELRSLRRLIDEARSLVDQPPEGLRISRYQVGFWDELCQLGVIDHQAEAWERQVGALRSLLSAEAVASTAAVDSSGGVGSADPIGPVQVPATVTAQLRPYQRDGFGWLTFLWQHRLGGILADDMGLGKTLQTLALIGHAREADPSLPPFLIVAPTSVVPNWVAEAARFAPSLSVVPVTDTMKRSGRSVEQLTAGAHVVVTTYTLLRLECDAYASFAWAGVVLDEAQHAKNHRSKVYRSLRQLPAPFKLAITGTPMENDLMELWSLLSITAPGLFPDPTKFAEHYARPIEREGDVARLAQLRRRIKPLVKRRTKEHVAADLPPKQEQVLEVELSPRHRKIYETRLQRERQRVLGLIDDFDRNRFTILRSITLLRQLSLHPALVDDSDDSDDGDGGDGGDDRGAVDDGARSGPAAARVPCAKLDTLVEHMEEVVEGGHRALVFSQFTGFLALVRERLDREGIDHCYLDGRTRDRAEVLRRFKEGTAPVFLISLKAGGFGLNLTEADYCFLLDPWWNPATEAQAVDRTHRIGQTRNVIVYRLVARDTIEEKVMALKQRKAELFTGVMDEGELFSTHLHPDDIRALFT